MNLNSFEAVFYTLAFLVPGFICDSVLNALVRRRREAQEASLLRFLSLSSLNYAIWAWLIYLLVKAEPFARHPVYSSIAWAVIILVSPFLLGVALGLLSQRETVRRFLQRLGFSTVHPIPNAWDYFFGRTAPVWILVTLHDGSIVSGRFAYKSLASSDRWNAGIWIAGKEIKHIEFWEFR